MLAPAMAQQMGIASLGTFHKRRGDQSLLDNLGVASAAWMRVLGEAHDQTWDSTVGGVSYQLAPRFDGRLWGFQVGLDLLGFESDWGQDRLGLFYTYTDSRGTIYGNTLAINGNRSGRLSLEGNSVGAYWTHIGQSRWYLDAVVMHTWLDGHAKSDDAMGADLDGTGLTASLEGGMPFRINGNWAIEPQAQLIWQRIRFDDTSDLFSTIDYDSFDSLTGRLGARLEGNMAASSRTPWQSFVSADVWHNFSETADVKFNGRNVGSEIKGTSLELRAGLSVRMTENIGGYASVGYTTNLGGEDRESISGDLGIRIRW